MDQQARSAAISAVNEIPGWLFEVEAWRLHEAARRAVDAGETAVIVEIGSFHGRSTVALARGVMAGEGEGRVHTIDPQEHERYRELVANLERAGVRDLVEPIRGTSEEGRARLAGSRVDVLFVDGSHEYEDVVADLAGWGPMLREGAVVALNDPFWLGVNRAMREQVAIRRGPYRDPSFTDNTVFLRYFSDTDRPPLRLWDLLRLRFVLRVGRLWFGAYHEPILASRFSMEAKMAVIRPPLRVLPRCFARILPARR